MSYLICEKCGGYYKLKEGESPEDFESCECGGNLKYIQNFNSHFYDEMDPLNELNICPNCGAQNLQGQNFCKSCKSKIESVDNRKKHSDSIKEDQKEFQAKEIIIRLLAIITGILIVLIPQLLIFDENYALLLLVIGGLVASLYAENTDDRALNATIVGLVAGLILLIFRSNIIFSNDLSYFDVFALEMVGPLLILTIFGLFGGLINIFIKYLISKYQNKEAKK